MNIHSPDTARICADWPNGQTLIFARLKPFGQIAAYVAWQTSRLERSTFPIIALEHLAALLYWQMVRIDILKVWCGSEAFRRSLSTVSNLEYFR
jgi:hypothetical protein